MQTIASKQPAPLRAHRANSLGGCAELAIELRIREFVAHTLLFNEHGYPYPDEDSFLQQGVIDSLGVLELVTFASREFGVQVESAEVTPENFDSVRRLADYIRRKQSTTEDKSVHS